MQGTLKLLLVEDDENLGLMLKDNLEMVGHKVDLCKDGGKGLTAFHNNDYHLCIFDVMLPIVDGFSLARNLRKYDQNTPIIFLTAKSQKADRIEGFKAGADDYIVKPFSLEELLLRVEAVLKRVHGRPTSADLDHLLCFGNTSLDVHNQLLNIAGTESKLTTKEAQLLKLLATHKNQVVERDTITKTVWGNDGYFVARSMDVFISKLRKYLKADPLIGIRNVHGIGYRLEVSAEGL